jgi:hypothetical protein
MSETVNETAGGLRVATPETGLSEDAVERLRGSLRGALLRPGDEGYDAARAVWNGMIDRRPELIVRCTGVADVIAAVTFARANDLLMAVRGGGHSVAGLSVWCPRCVARTRNVSVLCPCVLRADDSKVPICRHLAKAL